jgi:putative FmdB family regulatory protein
VPIFEYGCALCGHALDALQKHSDEPLVECPACGAQALKRKLSAPSFRLKGGGWYETDFKSDKRRNIAEGDSKSPDAKPADKPTDKPADKTAAKADKPAATESKKADAGTAAVKKPEAGKAGGVV